MIFNYNDKAIHYNSYGKGPAVLLLHGFLESSTMWKPLIPFISEKNSVIVIDLPGHGKSDWIAENHTMELMAEVVFSILDDLNIDKLKIIGHSMGGYIALAFIEAYESKVEELILLNSTSSEDSPERRINRTRALSIIEKNHTPYVQMAIKNLFPEVTHEQYASEIKMLKKEALHFPVEGIKAAIRGMRDRKNRNEVLKFFGNKKTMVSGLIDPIIPYKDSVLEALHTNTELKTVSGGHMSLIENLEKIKSICL